MDQEVKRLRTEMLRQQVETERHLDELILQDEKLVWQERAAWTELEKLTVGYQWL